MLTYNEHGELTGTLGSLEFQSLLRKHPLANIVMVSWQSGAIDILAQETYVGQETWFERYPQLVEAIYTPIRDWYIEPVMFPIMLDR